MASLIARLRNFVLRAKSVGTCCVLKALYKHVRAQNFQRENLWRALLCDVHQWAVHPAVGLGGGGDLVAHSKCTGVATLARQNIALQLPSALLLVFRTSAK